MQHAASHTTAVQPSSHNQRHVLIGKQWHQLPELIPTNSNSADPAWPSNILLPLQRHREILSVAIMFIMQLSY